MTTLPRVQFRSEWLLIDHEPKDRFSLQLWGFSNAVAMGALLFGPDADAKGEYWPYGVAGSRTTLTAFLGFCFEQGLHPKRLKPEDLFAPETMMFSKE